jgi:hypothetical protein
MAYQYFGSGAALNMLSKYFSLTDLTRTSMSAANIPNAAEIANLKKLALMGDLLTDNIGPFRWESAFRSQAVQNQLKAGEGGEAAASQAATKSYHSLGIAGDIEPLTMSAEKYFAKIASNFMIKSMLGEIALKKTVLHISLKTPEKQSVLMYVTPTGQYIRYTPAQVAAILAKYKTPIGLTGLLVASAAVAAYFIWKDQQRFSR